MKSLFSILILMVLGLPTFALIPANSYTTDVSGTLSARTIKHVQGSSRTINWRFVNTPGVAYDLTGASTVYLRYGPSDNLWGQTVTGSLVSVTNGTVTIPLTPANTATNGTFPFDLRVSDGTDILCQAYGDLILVSQAGASSASFPTGTNVDLLNYTFINYPWATTAEMIVERANRIAGDLAGSNNVTVAVGVHNTNTAAHADIRAMTTNATDAVARSHLTESSNTVHGGFILTAYQWGTNAYTIATNALAQISAHILESWQTVHSGYILTAWQTATNALHVAQTEGIFTAWLGTNTYVKVEADTVWGAVSNTVTTNAAAGQAHAATEHRVEYGGGFSAGAGSVASSGGAVGVNAKTSDGFAGGYCAYATDNGVSSGNGIDAIQLGTGGNTIPLSFNVYSFTLLNPDGTIPLDRTPSLLTTNAPEWIAVTNGAALGATALQPAQTNGWTVTSHDGLVPANRTITVNGQAGTLDSNVTFTVTGSTDAPAWIAATNTELAITITNDLERPQYLYATGAVSLAFAGLRTPQPFYLVVKGPDSITFPAGTHFVGGASWQTNQANHFIVWQYSTNLFVNPVTTSTED